MKLILYPISKIYEAITSFRNYLYDSKNIKSTKFTFPIISIGNLSTGGTGKTPHTDYLIQLLKNKYKTAVLSRGYGRKSVGYKELHANSKAKEVGDEPLFYKWKHPNVKVSVCEDRVYGIVQMAHGEIEDSVYILDDAFQHRSIKPGLSVLLTEYEKLFTQDSILPLGNLREHKKGAERADIIVVSKCPSLLSVVKKNAIISELKPKKYQHVFFSSMEYKPIYSVFNINLDSLEKDTTVLMVTGIANPTPMFNKLKPLFKNVYQRTFKDHYNFKLADIESIIRTWENLETENKIIITTEKDATRLFEFKDEFIKKKINIFCLPIEVNFDKNEKLGFDKAIKHYLSITLPKEDEEEFENISINYIE